MHFGNDPKPGDNMTNPIFVENDEYVVNRNAARKFKPMLDTLNFVVEPRFDNENTAHSAIDEAIAMNFLSEVGMQKGGQLKAIPTGNKGLSKLPENVRNKMGYMQEGGEVEDKRDRKGGYSLGVKDYYAQALGEFEKMGDFVGGATGSNRRAILEAAQEAGQIMETQEALDALQMIMDRHQQGTMNVMANPRQGYQYGGMTENQLYEKFGSRLTYGADRADFREAYGTPDVSSFLEARETMGTKGRQDLKNIRQQQAGALFQDPTATTQAYQSYETGTQRALDKALEQSELDALSYLADVEAEGASFDEDYTAPVNAPEEVAGMSQVGFSAGAPTPDGQGTFPQYNPFTENEYTAPNGNVYYWDSQRNQWVEGRG